MSLFDNGDPEEFLLFVLNFNINIAESGMLEMDAKIRYLHTLVRDKFLRQFYSFYSGVESMETLTVD